MISRSFEGSSPARKSTSEPGMRSRMVFASGERSSLIRTRVTARPSSRRGPFRIRASAFLREAALGGGKSRAQLDPRSEVVQPTLDRADHHQHVEVVEVAEVGDAEDPALGGVLA